VRVSAQEFPRVERLLTAPSLEHYGLLRDCAPYQRAAGQTAIARSRAQAQAVAPLLHTKIATLAAQLDWGGATSDAICGVDSAAPLSELVASLPDPNYLHMSSGPWVNFWDSIYGAWQLDGKGAPDPAGDSEQYVGTAAVKPDAFMIEGWMPNEKNVWRSDIVAATTGESAEQVEQRLKAHGDDRGVMNIDTDCDASQLRALKNAVKLALLDGARIRSVYVQAPDYRSVICDAPDAIGDAGNSMVFYSKSSPDDMPQVQQPITVVP
jgi:hypothetical protein